MDRQQLIGQWTQVAESGTLMSAKHDPNELSITWEKYRSVISFDLSSSLEGFIKSGEYAVNQYYDSLYPSGLGYYEVIPNAGSTFTVPGSGVPSGSVTPTHALDRLILIYGQKQGWHAYAETSSFISGAISSGRLSPVQSF
jgi:hypothetical protein